jgi:hypothetical protein
MNHPLSEASLHLLNRRQFLQSAGMGLGGIALTALLADQGMLGKPAYGATPIRPEYRADAPFAARTPHYAPRAKKVLMIFCSGACSHLETWDYKPELIKRDGQPMPGSSGLITFQGENGSLARPLWDFKPRGESGKYISEMVPHLAELADDMCFIHSMTAKSNTHGPAECQMNSGFIFEGFPSVGAWVSYGLGSECTELPAFVAIPDPRGAPQMGPNIWSAGFLPAVFQGVPFGADKPIPHLETPKEFAGDPERATRDFLRLLNEKHLEKNPGDTELSARMASYELAAKMQLRAAEVGNFANETELTKQMYCINDSNALKASFGRNCLLARRLLERDVRFVQLYNGAYAMGEGVGNWDGHKFLRQQYELHAPVLDEPCAALLKDLKGRGMLDDTLVVWCTEFGRMPTFQKGAQGRDHNPSGFTVWMAGAGVKRGFSYGATDEFGYKAVESISTIYDFHATILHLLGLNHEQLSFYHNGIERRLTDVHGQVIADVVA